MTETGAAIVVVLKARAAMRDGSGIGAKALAAATPRIMQAAFIVSSDVGTVAKHVNAG
jgi:hypothetical protein